MKNTLSNYFFVGTIVAQQPISFTVPDTKDPNKPKKKDERHNLPRIAGRLYATGSGIRGALRRCAERFVAESRGEKPDLETFYLNALGGVKNAEKEEADLHIVDRYRFIQEHNPLLSLFGSMANSLPGKLKVSHATAGESVQAVRFDSVRADDFRRTPAIIDNLQPSALDEYFAKKDVAGQRSFAKSRIKELKKKIVRLGSDDPEAKKSLLAELEAMEAMEADNKEIQIQLPNLSYEAIPQGASLNQEFYLEGVSDLELSFFLATLRKFAMSPYLGGHGNHGLGRVTAHWDVFKIQGYQRDGLGSVDILDHFGGLQLDGAIAQYLPDDFTVAGQAFNFDAKALLPFAPKAKSTSKKTDAKDSQDDN